ncbi:unnamed protein product [Cyclocybe aegerita]|uniref:F-box domain-containing protein n=1 Tax=Cyclocybe aegerita TaxID=1973307 RepID=A0A8S0W4P0_CYCAE|nr:unnamed protein product [Cyclocybe aegerita]
MHLALQNEDILHEIFWHLSAAPGYYFPPLTVVGRVETRALLSAALTCRLFTEPALDKLWWEIDTILAILGCLSSFAMDNEDGSESQTWYLNGPITSSDWTIVDKYARRVRSFQYNEEVNVDPSVYVQMLRSRPHNPLFPQLRNLHSLVGPGAGLLLCQSPSLRRVSIDAITEDSEYDFYPAIWNLIDELPESAPLLEQLSLEAALQPSAYSRLDRFQNMRSIHIRYQPYGQDEETPTDFALLTPLSSLPHLTRLSLVHGSPASPIVQKIPPTIADFSALTQLHFRAAWDQILTMLEVVRFDRLSFFSLHVIRPPAWTEDTTNDQWAVDGWKKIFYFLHTKTGGLLKELQLRLVRGWDDEFRPMPPGVQTPLYIEDARILRNLTIVNIMFPLVHSLTNHDVALLTEAWPFLESLHLMTEKRGTANFAAFVKIATGLPRLKKLGLCIRADDGLPNRHQVPILSHPLQEFDVMGSSIDDPSKLACLLDRLFPNLFTYLSGPIKNSDWDVIDKYAKRVRSLYFIDSEGVDASVYLHLMRSRPNVPLFPYLQDLCANLESGTALMLLHTPSLRRIFLGLQGPPGERCFPAIWNFVDELPESAPRLERLDLGLFSLRLPDHTHRSLRRCQNLRSLHVFYGPHAVDAASPTDPSTLGVLSELDHLNHLHFSLGSATSPVVHKRPLSTAFRFLSLTRLTVSAAWSQVVPLMSAASFIKLASLDVEVLEPYPWQTSPDPPPVHWGTDAWTSFIELLRNNINHTIEELSVRTHTRVRDQPDQTGLQRPKLGDLSFLPNLTKLHIACPFLPTLINEDIFCLSEACPRLQHLHLQTQFLGSIDFRALMIIADALPDLRSLGLSIHAETIPHHTEIPVKSHRLEIFDPLTSSIKHPANFAHSFDRIFPHIEDLLLTGRAKDLWSQIDSLLRKFQIARQDEVLRVRDANPNPHPTGMAVDE